MQDREREMVCHDETSTAADGGAEMHIPFAAGGHEPIGARREVLERGFGTVRRPGIESRIARRTGEDAEEDAEEDEFRFGVRGRVKGKNGWGDGWEGKWRREVRFEVTTWKRCGGRKEGRE